LERKKQQKPGESPWNGYEAEDGGAQDEQSDAFAALYRALVRARARRIRQITALPIPGGWAKK
jgi:hypothetical protein